jgi:DNA-binding CsgD family transcriptional regulator
VSAFSLSVTEVAHLRTVVDLCAAPPERASEVVWPVLESLQALVGCEMVVLNGVSPLTYSHYHRQFFASGARGVDPVEGVEGPDFPFWRFYRQCRPCEYPDRVAEPVVVIHDDFYTRREWLQHPMHVGCLEDVFDEMLLSIPDGEGRSARLLFPRGPGRPYGQREKFALTLLAPHLQPLLLAARTPPPLTRPPITDRQWQILERVRLGLANKQIARDLGVAPGTVRKHLENVYRSLDVQSRGAAVHVAFGEVDGPAREVGV